MAKSYMQQIKSQYKSGPRKKKKKKKATVKKAPLRRRWKA